MPSRYHLNQALFEVNPCYFSFIFVSCVLPCYGRFPSYEGQLVRCCWQSPFLRPPPRVLLRLHSKSVPQRQTVQRLILMHKKLTSNYELQHLAQLCKLVIFPWLWKQCHARTSASLMPANNRIMKPKAGYLSAYLVPPNPSLHLPSHEIEALV